MGSECLSRWAHRLYHALLWLAARLHPAIALSTSAGVEHSQSRWRVRKMLLEVGCSSVSLRLATTSKPIVVLSPCSVAQFYAPARRQTRVHLLQRVAQMTSARGCYQCAVAPKATRRQRVRLPDSQPGRGRHPPLELARRMHRYQQTAQRQMSTVAALGGAILLSSLLKVQLADPLHGLRSQASHCRRRHPKRARRSILPR